MKIYSLKELESQTCELFMSLKGVARYLLAKKPVNNKFYTVSGIQGQDKDYHEVNESALAKCMEECHAQNGANYALSLWLEEDWGFQNFEAQYILGTVSVIEDEE